MPKQVLIVGAGVIGLSTALYCARKGHVVTIVDKSPAARSGCSFGNAGMIVPSHFVPLAAPGMVALGLKWMWNPESPLYIKPRLNWELLSWGFKFWRACSARHVAQSAPLLRDLSLASRGCYEELADSSGNSLGLEKRGLLMLCKTAHVLEEEARLAERAHGLGLPAEVLSAKQAAALDPNIRMEIAGAVYFLQDCHLSPQRLMDTLERQLTALGARFLWETEVTGWRVEGAKVTAAKTAAGDLTAGGDLTADEYVLCGGSWSPGTARDLRLRLPMQAGKGYSLTLPKPPELPRICAILNEARVAVTPIGTSLRFGGTMEIAGLHEPLNPRRVQGIIHSVSDYYPAFTPADFAGIAPWSGLRPCSPDGLPYLGRSSRYSNLLIATGHAMLGVSLGPITGQIVSQLISGEPTSVDVSRLSPDRWG